MVMEVIAKLDEKGRILIPKKVRDEFNLGEGDLVKIYVEGNRIVIEPLVSVKKVRMRVFDEVFLDAGEATFGE